MVKISRFSQTKRGFLTICFDKLKKILELNYKINKTYSTFLDYLNKCLKQLLLKKYKNKMFDNIKSDERSIVAALIWGLKNYDTQEVYNKLRESLSQKEHINNNDKLIDDRIDSAISYINKILEGESHPNHPALRALQGERKRGKTSKSMEQVEEIKSIHQKAKIDRAKQPDAESLSLNAGKQINLYLLFYYTMTIRTMSFQNPTSLSEEMRKYITELDTSNPVLKFPADMIKKPEFFKERLAKQEITPMEIKDLTVEYLERLSQDTHLKLNQLTPSTSTASIDSTPKQIAWDDEGIVKFSR